MPSDTGQPEIMEPSSRPIVIEQDRHQLNADLTLPSGRVKGVVLFAHGSGSSRLSPRNRKVARYLVEQGMATLLLDLLTDAEEREDERTRELRFDIPLLANRLVGATDWLKDDPDLKNLPVGYFGASTGAAAALIAAAKRPAQAGAVVSRGGRPDLAGDALSQVQAATRLIVGGLDTEVIRMNEEAAHQMHCRNQLNIVPGATHLFEEPDALEQVAELAGDWFRDEL